MSEHTIEEALRKFREVARRLKRAEPESVEHRNLQQEYERLSRRIFDGPAKERSR